MGKPHRAVVFLKGNKKLFSATWLPLQNLTYEAKTKEQTNVTFLPEKEWKIEDLLTAPEEEHT